MQKVRWGILSTAKIGREKVIPAMQKGEFCAVVAIASRNIDAANAEAKKLNIAKAYGSYEELLQDKEIDAGYIPLPNDMHVEWAMKCLEADKHVLCEKPIGLTSQQAQQLLDAAKQKPHLKVMEAFMYRFHPQWKYAKKLVDDKVIGDVKTIQSFFSYYNIDPNNIRNKKEAGGGGMMDIGCYCVSFARFIFSNEPEKVFGLLEFDPQLQTDRIASGILDFTKVTSTFTCSTQLFTYQRVNILGTEGRIEIQIPFNAPPDSQTEIWHHSKAGPGKIVFDPVDQYTLQGDTFSKCILENTDVPFGLEDAVNNMKVIEAIFKISDEGKWITIK
ncbi:MAG TPA: Gfo/Idh/MocA family oxidoreductase [Chitinophagaceae bacterium]